MIKKELVVSIETTEPEISMNVRILQNSEGQSVLISHEQAKFAVNIKDLHAALTEIDWFYQMNTEKGKKELFEDLSECIGEVEYPDSEESYKMKVLIPTELDVPIKGDLVFNHVDKPVEQGYSADEVPTLAHSLF
jgi:hypothetical protein